MPAGPKRSATLGLALLAALETPGLAATPPGPDQISELKSSPCARQAFDGRGTPGGNTSAGDRAELAARLSGGRFERAPLTLRANGIDDGVSIVVLCESDVFVALSDLKRAAVPMPGAVSIDFDGDTYVSAASLAPKVGYSVDLAHLVLDLSADSSLLPHAAYSLAPASVETPATASTSGFLNYVLTANVPRSGPMTSGFVQAGVGGGPDLLTATGEFSGTQLRRGLVAYSIESQQHLTRLTLGDELATTSMLGGSDVIGGFASSRHFEFAPGYVYFPTAGVSGTVLTPTTADVYVNGAYLRTVELPPGQFDFSNIPVPAGSSVTQVVLHDAAGNTQTLTGSFYSTRTLLAKGVTDFNYHAGLLRANPFGSGDRYGPFAALGDYRLGVSNTVTAGGRLETTKRLVSGGPEIEIALPVGQLDAEFGASDAGGVHGTALGAAYDVQTSRYNATISAETMSANYATTSLAPDARRTRSSLQQSVTFPVNGRISVGFSHTTTVTDGVPVAAGVNGVATIRLARDLSLGLNAGRSRGGSVLGVGSGPAGNRWTIGTSATYLLGRETSFFADSSNGNGNGGGGSSATIEKGVPNQLGFGYMVRAASGAQGGTAASASLHTPVADITVLANGAAGASSAETIVAGSVVGFKQGLFFARPTGTGYALAETNGFPHTAIFVGDSYAGRTSRRGTLVVSNLAAYADNALAVDEMKDRTDVVEASPLIDVKPKIYSGIVAPFEIHTIHAYLGHVVVRRHGEAIVPAFGMLSLTQGGHDYTSDLGSEGQFYFDAPPGGAFTATVMWAKGSCMFTGTFPAPEDTVTRLGTLTCNEQ